MNFSRTRLFIINSLLIGILGTSHLYSQIHINEIPKANISYYEGIIISELMSADQETNSDEHGEYDDWIELYNTNDFAVDIAGLSFTDSLELPIQSIIPSDSPELTTIPARGYLILWADNQPEQGPLHLNFKLRESGEDVGIFSLDGMQLDAVSYPNQYNNFSYARLEDEEWFAVPPTFGLENIVPEISNIYINEFMADNDNRVLDEYWEYDDWFELYNANNFDVNVAGLYISDSLGYPNKYRISSKSPEVTIIPAKGFLQIWTDGDSEQGPLHANFKLSRDGDQIGLFNYDYRIPVDTHTFTKQPRNFACGKVQESGAWINMPPTPGASNILPELSGLFINEIMTSNTNVIADNHGEFDDWIELYNGGTVSIDLGGLFVSDSIGDPKPSRISSEHPDSTTLEPGKFLMLWADDSDEQGVLHTNFKLSRSGEQVVLFGYDSKEIIDSITYNEVPRNFTFGRIADGIKNWGELVQPTPNRSNTITDLNTASFISSGFKYNTYPNPSSDQTVFQIQIPEDTRLVIKVYSNTGELAAIPVNEFYQAGSYDITWDLSGGDGNRLSNGLYFYTIETEDISIQDKLIIMHR